jgi:hypothetical protein
MLDYPGGPLASCFEDSDKHPWNCYKGRQYWNHPVNTFVRYQPWKKPRRGSLSCNGRRHSKHIEGHYRVTIYVLQYCRRRRRREGEGSTFWETRVLSRPRHPTAYPFLALPNPVLPGTLKLFEPSTPQQALPVVLEEVAERQPLLLPPPLNQWFLQPQPW